MEARGKPLLTKLSTFGIFQFTRSVRCLLPRLRILFTFFVFSTTPLQIFAICLIWHFLSRPSSFTIYDRCVTKQEIKSLKYRVVITSPERILNDWRFSELWKSKSFVNKLRGVIFDEAHCISMWSGDFRPDYANVGRLRWVVPVHVVFYAASATMPDYVLADVKTLLHMRSDTREIRLTNDRPNIHLATVELLDPLNSCPTLHRRPSWSSVMIARKLSAYAYSLDCLCLLTLSTSCCGSILG